MSIIVQKFGGTSVADSKKILAAARKAIRAKMDGYQVVMVVSAMGQNTDVLIDLAKQISDSPPPREMDMLLSTGEQVSVALMAMAIHSLGHEAISLTGGQIGIITDSTHTKARIHSISTDRIHKYLDQGKIVIAAGFQGIDESFNITTLGRGGATRRLSPWRPCWAPWHVKSIPMSMAFTPPTRGSCPKPAGRRDQLRRDARIGLRRGGGDAQPLDRVRQELFRSGARAEQFQRRAGHDDRARAGGAEHGGLRGGLEQGRGAGHAPAECPTIPARPTPSFRESPPKTFLST